MGFEVVPEWERRDWHMKCPHSWAAPRQKKNKYFEWEGDTPLLSELPKALSRRREVGFHDMPVMMDGLGGKSIHMEMLHHKYLHRAAVSM